MEERRFINQPSAKYQQAVDIIRQLLKAEDLDHVTRVYAEATWKELKNEFAQQSGGESLHEGHVCFHRLKGAKECLCDIEGELTSPVSDHLTEVMKDGKTLAIVAQPYAISLKESEELQVFCKKHGFSYRTSASESWHFPGKTLLVEIRPVAEKE
jgi:hypothetical protein